jgi:hypothetical protein
VNSKQKSRISGSNPQASHRDEKSLENPKTSLWLLDSIQRELRSPVLHNFSSNMAVWVVQVVTLAHVG